MKQPKIEIRKIEMLKNWENNPRDITPEGFERLKEQIKELDIYKPLLIHEDGTVLGGNMRLRAFREMGITDVTVSVVNAPSEEMKIKYALSDNDQVGVTNIDSIMNIIGNYPDIDFKNYAIDTEGMTTIDKIIAQYKDNEYGTDFSLPDGGKSGFEQITFTLSKEQAEFIRSCIDSISIYDEDFGNENKNGNALYTICKQWETKSSK